jgi:nucleoside phosphorylase/tetratricopeptide (TPR) repeat protein
MNWSTDVLIVTATKVESKAVVEVIGGISGKAPEPVPIGDRMYQDLGIINNARVFLVQSEMGTGGLSASQQTIQKGIEALSPVAVIMTGIAFGIDYEKQAIGDVLVSLQLMLYELQRVGTDDGKIKLTPRGDRPHASPWLIDRFRSADLYWDDSKFKVHFGLILSGEKLVDNIDFRKQLQEFEPEAIGGEMEGAGLYVACGGAKVDWILVKSICDWADGQKGKNKEERQRLAAYNAASFVLHLLQHAPLNREENPLSREHIEVIADSEIAHLATPKLDTEQPFFDFDPPTKNEIFIGRVNILDEIQLILSSTSTKPHIYVLTGSGGLGKTQIATEYIYRRQGFYKYIWWLKSDEPAILRANYAGLGDILSHEPDFPKMELENSLEAISAIRTWLGMDHEWRWLIVLDNAIDAEEVRDFLPRQGPGHIIITSRNSLSQWESIASKKRELKEFSKLESIEFLIRRTELQDQEGAGKLAEKLGNFPLALEQAGAYIKDSAKKFSDYLELFQKQQHLLLGSNKPLDYPNTVTTTWELSFQRVHRDSAAATDLLNLCAFLASNDIPRWLIVEGAKYLPEPLASIAKNEYELDKVIAILRRHSLISAVENLISIHKLVQAVTRDKLERESQNIWATAAVDLINSAFKFDENDVKTWTKCSRLLQHALASSNFPEERGIALESTRNLLINTSYYLKNRAEYASSISLLERSLNINEKLYGSNHPEYARNLMDIGKIFQRLGNLIEAKKSFETALEINRIFYGEVHPNIAIALSNLGKIQMRLGDLEDAKKSFEKDLEITRSLYGEAHPDIAAALSNLGKIQMRLGDLEDAKKSFETALEINRSLYGEVHPNIAAALSNLGKIQMHLGDLEDAKKSFEKDLEINRSLYGEVHPNIAAALSNLGKIQINIGDLKNLEEAKMNYERNLKINKQIYGAKHRYVGNMLKNLQRLASLFFYRGKARYNTRRLEDLKEAKRYFENALQINKLVFGPNDSKVANALHYLNEIQYILGDSEGEKMN